MFPWKLLADILWPSLLSIVILFIVMGIMNIRFTDKDTQKNWLNRSNGILFLLALLIIMPVLFTLLRGTFLLPGDFAVYLRELFISLIIVISFILTGKLLNHLASIRHGFISFFWPIKLGFDFWRTGTIDAEVKIRTPQTLPVSRIESHFPDHYVINYTDKYALEKIEKKGLPDFGHVQTDLSSDKSLQHQAVASSVSTQEQTTSAIVAESATDSIKQVVAKMEGGAPCLIAPTARPLRKYSRNVFSTYLHSKNKRKLIQQRINRSIACFEIRKTLFDNEYVLVRGKVKYRGEYKSFSIPGPIIRLSLLGQTTSYRIVDRVIINSPSTSLPKAVDKGHERTVGQGY